MSRSPVVQMQNWLFNNQQWFCAPLGANQHDHFWSEYSEALQDATDIRTQLNEQLRCLDYRVETQVSVVAELQDFFRRRAEVEMDYSKNLDKLARSLLARHKEQKQKREQWHLFSSYACWQHLVAQTKRQARDHAILGEIYSTTVIQRLSQVTEEVQRIYRRCREVGYESHEELLKVLHELHAAMKTWQTYQVEYRQAETKLRYVESQRAKLESTIARDKLEKSKKFKLIEKEIVKRRNKFNDAHVKALKARNEYVLCMDAANAAIHKYFIDDLSDIIDCMDIGFHSCVARALMMHISAEENVRRSLQVSVDGMNKCLSNLDSRADKQRFLEANHAAFMIPKKFDSANYQHKIDEATHELSVSSQLREDLESRFGQLHKRLTSLRAESEEVWKTLETAESTLMDMISAKDYDVTPLFTAAAAAAAADDDKSVALLAASLTAAMGKQQPEAAALKLRADRQETEDFYLTKFREYVLGSNLMHRLQAKHDLIHKALNDSGQLPTSPKLPASAAASGAAGAVGGVLAQQLSNNKPRRRRIGRTPLIGQPKLFGGSLEEYLEVTNEEIPLIMKSCIRVINLYGLHHQGIFRVSGSQVEINNFREAFERCEDPLADVTDASDINSVAGVFKLFLRELREPLFPIVFFDQFMEIAQLDLKEEFKIRMREVVQTLPRAVFIVMRYLFSFLNHLSEYSDENMMDPYNLAICFGPTLVPVPEDKDQVQYQNLVNELIKNIIINAEDIFPNDGGTVYERYITREPDEGDVGEAPSDTMSEDVDSEVYPSEDDSVFREKDISIQIFGKSETLEAVAQFDFTARSQRELSFKKGDVLTLYTQVSGDWWKGSKDGRDGLVPDKYIMLRIRDEDRERMEMAKAPSAGSTASSGSDVESIRRRTSSSSDASGSVSMATRTPKALHSSQRIQTVTPVLSASSTLPISIISASDPSIDSIPSLPSPNTDKRIGSRSTDHHRPGVTVALVRPTSLSSGGGSNNISATLSAGTATNGTISEPESMKTSPVSAILSMPIMEQNSVSKEKLEIVSAVNDVLVGGETTPAPAAAVVAAAISTSTLSEETATLDDDDGTASLALSDEKSLSDSFNSLIDVEMDEQHHVIGESANQLKGADQSSQPLDTTGLFKRQTWETRSLERHQPVQAVNITVGEWCETKAVDGVGASPAASGVNKGSFVRKRDLWEKRSSLTSAPVATASATAASPISRKHTPDLVMDLPPSLPLSSSPKDEKSSAAGSSSNGSDSSEDADSPTSPDMTAAETFAMQSQSTLKKSKVVKKEPEAAPDSAVKLQVAAFSCAPPVGGTSAGNPAAAVALKTTTTPKLATRFPHLYGTPMPVLPNAFAASGDASGAQLIKLKPTVMKKPSLPSAVGASPEANRRSSSSSSSSYHSDSSNV